jgi:hypothetical protein
MVDQPWFVESLGDITREVLRQRRQLPVRLRLNECHPLVRTLINSYPQTPSRGISVGLFLSAALNAKDLLMDDTIEVLNRELLALLGAQAGAAS